MTDTIPQDWFLEELDLHVQRVTQKNDIGNTNVLTISAQKGLVNQLEYFNKSVSSKNLDGYTLIKKGDFAYNKSYSKGYPVGVIRRLTDYNQGVLSPLYICFKVSSDKCSDKYLSYFFDGKYFEHQLSSRIQEGARAHGLINIPIGDFLDTLLLLPPPVEQEKIADILTSVDDTIEHTQAQVAKLQDLKTATMNELLTRGIGHTEFRESELGLIPTTWGISQIGNHAELLTNGFVGSAVKYYVDDGVSYLRSTNIRANKIDERDLKFITEEFHNKTSKSRLKKGDLLTVQSGHVGSTAVVPADYDGANCHALILTRLKRDQLLPSFVAYYLNSKAGMLRLSQYFVGSTIIHLNTSDLKVFEIPIPPLNEQEKIADILTSLDDQIEAVELKLVQLESLKKSLMGDLLTGRVRVSVD